LGAEIEVFHFEDSGIDNTARIRELNDRFRRSLSGL